MPRSTRSRLWVAAVLAVAGTAVFAPQAPAQRANNVTITGTTFVNYAFSPKTVKIAKGKTVHWSWNSNAPHNVTFVKGTKHSATGAQESYRRTFKKKGTYKYFCSVHDFTGKVVVG
jgi:plastocyanin